MVLPARSFVRPHGSPRRPHARHAGHRAPRSARAYKERSRNFAKLDRRLDHELQHTANPLKRLQFLILRGLLTAREAIARNSGGSVDGSKLIRIYDGLLVTFRKTINFDLTMQQFLRSLPRTCLPRNTHVFRSFVAGLAEITRKIDEPLATLFQKVCDKAASARSRCMRKFMTLITPDELKASPA